MPDVGEFSHLVTIEAPAGALEVGVATVETSVPAAIAVQPIQFQPPEVLTGGGLVSQTVYIVSLWYREDLQANYVLVEECCTQRRFQILAVVPRDRRDGLELRCVTVG